ncbi:sigma-54-dependent Fis family transcriptional regulator [Amycolatopsis methanolica]|uniref:sigma-54-dependent Fis family transcriptional regulator n=1 Tax=Amycolatopsis methanolica TaxID=1814 RepID=UPI0003699CB8|nr:helix-turn-helix domain-containing protein [Amycolatopsis methanolica]
MESAALRPEIAKSWRRAELSGLRPDAAVDRLTVADIDRRSRLVLAAEPVLDQATRELAGTAFSLILADRDAWIVDRRFGERQLESTLDRLGVVPGRRFTEENTGTNSIATVFELRQGLAVHGHEHFIDSFKPFACYGHPITHPVTRRLEGVLDITCPADHASPLLGPFLRRAVADIEQRLLEGSRAAEQRMLAAYQAAALNRLRPVLVLGDDVVLANAAATDLLDAADHAVLRGLAMDAPFGVRQARSVRLSSGRVADVSFERITGASGVLFELEPPTVQAIPRRATPRPVQRDFTTYREQRTHVLISGEPGTGRSTVARELAGESALAVLDAVDAQRWAPTLDQLVASHTGLLVIENIALLPADAAARVGAVMDRGWFAFTGPPPSELTGPAADLASRCIARRELAPLRSRRDELPALVAAMLADLGSTLRFVPSTLEVLAAQPWPGNLRELKALLRHVAAGRACGDVLPRDLPEAYQGSPRARHLTPIEQLEHDAIAAALRDCGGNKAHAAKLLGISRSTLHRRVRTLGLS